MNMLKECDENGAYAFDAALQAVPDKGGAYVVFPWNIREEFGRGRAKVHAAFDGVPYDGSIVNMGVRDEAGEICYIIGVLKSIRQAIRKQPGDIVRVTVSPCDKIDRAE